MNKKDYLKPTMNIVQLQQQTHLMAGSGVQSMRSGYGEAQEETWDDPDPASSRRGYNVWDNEEEQD